MKAILQIPVLNINITRNHEGNNFYDEIFSENILFFNRRQIIPDYSPWQFSAGNLLSMKSKIIGSGFFIKPFSVGKNLKRMNRLGQMMEVINLDAKSRHAFEKLNLVDVFQNEGDGTVSFL